VLENTSDGTALPKLPMDRGAPETRLHTMAREIQGNGPRLQGSLTSC